MEFKVGDRVVGVKDIHGSVNELYIKNKRGTITEILTDVPYPYRVEFKERVDYNSNNIEEWNSSYFDCSEIKKITGIILNKLLED